jgi:formylglycine-generating enzyme required for sulfatase activity
MRVIALLVTLAAAVAPRAHAVQFDMAVVGNLGNAPDTNFYPKNNPGNLRFGSVPYAYRIGRTEVTNGQYVDFLNAVASTDLHGLFNQFVSPADPRYGIVRQGTVGSYAYSIKPNMGNKPVANVSYWDAARFINWLHNGQPSGAPALGSTETGAYALNGVTNPTLGSNILRQSGARWFLPTENEWFKAAFFDFDKPGGPGYYKYPTGFNSAPSLALDDAVGNVSNPGSNIANYSSGANWNGLNGNVTSVGSALSVSPAGTYDQGGNVSEWTETLVYPSPLQYAVRGGDYGSIFVADLSTEDRGVLSGDSEFPSQGFRIGAVIPEPTSAVMALLVGLIGFSLRLGRADIMLK